jgi:hypothetical protein
MPGYAPIYTRPTMYWSSPTWGFNVPATVRDAAMPAFSGLGAVTPTDQATAIATVLTGVVKMAVYGVAGYFVGKWAGASPGWTAASTAVFGPVGTAGAVYFTGRKTKPNRRRAVRSNSNLKPFKSLRQRWLDGEVKVVKWDERDRLWIAVQDIRTGQVIAEWWDQDAADMFEDGFFDRRNLDRSVIDYLSERVIPKKMSTRKRRG